MAITILQPRVNIKLQEELAVKAMDHYMRVAYDLQPDLYSDSELLKGKPLPSFAALCNNKFKGCLFVILGLEYTDKRLPDNSVLFAKILQRLGRVNDFFILEHILDDQVLGLDSLLSRTVVKLASRSMLLYSDYCLLDDKLTKKSYKINY